MTYFTQTLWEIGDSPSEVRNLLNGNFSPLYTKGVYNVLRYGIVGDDETDNTEKIQALIDEVKVSGGTIYFPAGIYRTHTLTLDSKVHLVGDRGRFVSQIKSISAEPLINLVLTTYTGTHGITSNLFLNGDHVGTIGLNLRHHSGYFVENCIFGNFTTYQVKMSGSIGGEFNNCMFWGDVNGPERTAVGVYAEKDTSNFAPNLNAFNGCKFACNKLAFNFTNGAGIRLNYCDFVNNGVAGDATTGCIKYKNNEHVAGKWMAGIQIDGCWFDTNNGTIILFDDDDTANNFNTNLITNCNFLNISSANDIRVEAATTTTRVVIRGSTIADSGTNVILNGTKAILINEGSDLGNITTNGNIYNQPIDMNGFIKPALSAAPSVPTEGMIYSNTSDHHLYYYNGTDWVQLDN